MEKNSELHVVFGTGPLGKWTARELVKMGKTVRMINRSGKVDRLPADVEILASDAYDVKKNIEVTKGAAAIYQCAQPHYYEWAEKFPPLQSAILEAAAQNGAKLIVGDNLYMYGHFTGKLTEDFPIQPNTRKGKVHAAMAQEVLDAHQEGKIRAAIGRASDFFGPDDYSLTSYAILPAVQGKKANLMGRTDQPHSFTYIQDFGRLLATLGTQEKSLGQVWFTPTNPPITQTEFIKLIEAEINQPVKAMIAGPLMTRFLGLFIKEMKEMVEMIFEWTDPYVIDSSKAEKTFGLKPTPFKEAIRETVAWCKEEAAKEKEKGS